MNTKEPSRLQIKVKAKQLFNAQLNLKGEKLQEKIDQFTELTTNNGLGSPYGGKNKDQNTDIQLGSKMIWSISISKEKGDEDYAVLLDSIVNSNSGFFNKITKENGNFVGEVTTNRDFIDKGEEYIINFHIQKGDETSVVLPIDPRLKIKP
ncbi:hypothetical protein [Winogradskyella vincentii]|uniref:Uncharacterized protein n=1 Tax=Winogradskyella vincentii TaxID=2877122 RepID=A0ABS7XZI5_9FLAO|nr:hypothetical protein [Winogradskyella vincentii]MCA0153070.1 hypothetical protein [Winogradskyella vincentii]